MGGSEEQVYPDVFLQTGGRLNREYENWLFPRLGVTGKVPAEQSWATSLRGPCPLAYRSLLRRHALLLETPACLLPCPRVSPDNPARPPRLATCSCSWDLGQQEWVGEKEQRRGSSRRDTPQGGSDNTLT